jgi:hypothetical protein
MLSCGIPSFVIGHQIFRAMESQMKSRPGDIVFENTIAALGYFTGIGAALRTTGLFDPGDNTCIRDQVIDRFLPKGISDLCRDSGRQNNTDAPDGCQKGTLSLS